MTDIEREIKETSARLFDLYEDKRNSGLLNSKQSYEERKKAYSDNAILQMRIDLAYEQLRGIQHEWYASMESPRRTRAAI